MVSEDVEGSTFNKIPEMSDGKVDSQQLPVNIDILPGVTSSRSRKLGPRWNCGTAPTPNSKASIMILVGAPVWVAKEGGFCLNIFDAVEGCSGS